MADLLPRAAARRLQRNTGCILCVAAVLLVCFMPLPSSASRLGTRATSSSWAWRRGRGGLHLPGAGHKRMMHGGRAGLVVLRGGGDTGEGGGGGEQDDEGKGERDRALIRQLQAMRGEMVSMTDRMALIEQVSAILARRMLASHSAPRFSSHFPPFLGSPLVCLCVCL